ncbi:phage tail sheath family protein [Massilia endophytica]|uniref:phage tail sheath family protein n=1 Tax=Massilia endophytica TaxID=2899220 RepID=UPI001E5BCF59|nr:phage tail sheath C-terminal domain-containing protein [Massilia endophytica]UGQ48171.1 phage tail sheath family protein [Massilia endophytica]
MAAAQYQTPGVYVVEQDGFSSSVVQVPTAVPVFIGFTEVAANGNQDLTNVAMPISSMAEFQKYYAGPNGGAPQPQFTYAKGSTTMPPLSTVAAGLRFNLYYSLMMFFNNGGGRCYIMSIGSYTQANTNGTSAGDYTTALLNLVKYLEPTMVVAPDTMLLSWADWETVSLSILEHCESMQSRVAIFDVWNGYLPADGTPQDPVNGAGDGKSGFYPISSLGEDFNKYGIAYYPWVNTTLVSQSSLNYTWFTAASLATLQADMTTEATTVLGMSGTQLQQYQSQCIQAMVVPPVPNPPNDPTGMIGMNTIHRMAMTVSPLYQQAMTDLATSVNLMPTAGGMAGVYTRNDNAFGVFQAPANTTIVSAISPAVNLSDSEQGALNLPLNGVAINAIRTFPNTGLLVWGARTMAGNSDDWRYVSVRRTMIMLEQSIKAAMQAYVFQANDNLTWVAINSTITNFLTSQWKAGALVGSKPSEAFTVAVGLGQTMTGEDILQGYLRVQVQVAVVRPAEFIVLTFQQMMQTS